MLALLVASVLHKFTEPLYLGMGLRCSRLSIGKMQRGSSDRLAAREALSHNQLD